MTTDEQFQTLLDKIERNTQRLTELENRKGEEKSEKKEPTAEEIKAKEEVAFIKMMKTINSKND